MDHLDNGQVTRAKTVWRWFSGVPGSPVGVVLLSLALGLLPTPYVFADTCDVDNDCDIDRLDIRLISGARNTPALPGDPRDANGDGVINVNDARQCAVQCSLGRCAVSANLAPLADAGQDQALAQGAEVQLTGSANDPNGNPLTYQWTLQVPAGSASNLSNPTAANPSFVADVPGDYVATLVASDCELESAADTVLVSAAAVNGAPTADAGPDQVVDAGATVNLSGAGSSDPNNDPLTYAWILTSPAGSNADLNDDAAISPIFVADVVGDYTATLIVNDGMVDSVSDSVRVTANAVNLAPTLAAVNDSQLTLGDNFSLQLVGNDPNGDSLTYSLDSAPNGMSVNANTGELQWTPLAGQLGANAVTGRVSDPGGLFATRSFMVTVNDLPNGAPIANAGADQSVNAGTVVSLDGSGSSDPQDDALTFAWTLDVPPGSGAFLSDPNAVNPTFSTDLPGVYIANLVVNDGEFNSPIDSATITAAAVNQPPTLALVNDSQLTLGDNFSLQLVGDDPNGDSLTYSLDSAPNGMSVNANTGQLQWTPLAGQLGANAVTARASDPEGLFATRSFSVTVNDIPNTAPIANAGADQSVDAGTVVTLDGSGSSDPQDDALSFAWTLDVPAGSGAFLSNPNAVNPTFSTDLPGVYTANLFVNDGEFNSPIDSATITAAAVNQAPTLAPIDDQSVGVGALLDVQANGNDPDAGDTLTYSLPTAPAGMSIDGATGQISWTPLAAQVGLHPVQVRVEDLGGLSATQDFNVTVFVGNAAPTAVNDENYEVIRQSSVAIPVPGVLGNDTDADNDPLTASLVTDVSQGVLNFAADGSFDYTPALLPESVPEMQQQCRRSLADGPQQTNGTLAVGDVDNDGDIEIVGANHINSAGTPELWILNASDCSVQLASSPDVLAGGGITQSSHSGLLDIDGDGDLEIIAVRRTTGIFGGGNDHLIAMHHDGTLAWGDGSSEALSVRIRGWFANGPTFADLNADGVVEIIMTYEVGFGFGSLRPGIVAFDSRDGSVLWEYNEGLTTRLSPPHLPPAIADLDLDGTLEVIFHGSVLDHNGNLEFELDTARNGPRSTPSQLVHAIANFDNDAFPEILVRDQANHYLLEHDGSVKWQIARANSSVDQIAVADFDGDGEMEYAYNTSFGGGPADGFMVMYDTDGSLLWSHENEPSLQVNAVVRADATNPMGFDYNRDGAVDLVVHLELLDPLLPGVYIFDGRDGSILEHLPTNKYNPSYLQAFTAIADVDGDGEAEIVTSFTGGLTGETIVWGSAPGSTLPPAPNFRNQWVFNLAMVNPDLSIPANPVPAWLRPGMNGYNYVPVALPLDPIITDTFEYQANDGTADSNVATAFIDILPFGQNAPRFVSAPDTKATVGFAYDYVALAADTNFGDTLTYSLVNGPAGMTINANTGRVAWGGGAVGNYPVSLDVTDGLFTDTQDYVITVGDAVIVPNVLGQTLAVATATLTGADLEVGLVTRLHDAAAPVDTVIEQTPGSGQNHEFGGAVDLVLSIGPAPEDIDDDSDGFTENGGDCNDNDNTIFPGAVDIPDDGIDQDCSGSDATSGPALVEIVITPAIATLIVGQSQPLQATGVLADDTSLDLTGTVVWSTGGSVFNAIAPGDFTITANSEGVTGSSDITVVPAVADATNPFAEITTPSTGDSVTAPIDVMGSATDANFVKYTLALAPAGSNDFSLIKEETAPVTGGVLGQLDPTLLMNGTYTLRLSVFDAGGNGVFTETSVIIEDDLKVGNFSASFTDLAIPMSGIPITVTRTYDSRDRRSGDFGYGWQLDVSTLSLTSTDLGVGWQVASSGFFSVALTEVEAHTVSMVLPDGRVEKFSMRVTPNTAAFQFVGSLRVSFVPLPGTVGALSTLDNDFVLILDNQPGLVSLFDDNTLNLFDPQRFRYTGADGTRIDLHKRDGISQIQDPSGNTLTFNDNGIVHSAGKSVTFARDGMGRITSITDPMGNVQRYTYDANGDLVLHADGEGFETKFAYNRLHGLLRVTDPLNRVVARTEYDDDGRLTRLTNAAGQTVTFERDLDSRQEVITDFDGNVTVVEYDDSGNILRETDPLGGVNNFTYDVDGNQLTFTNPLGQTTTKAYNAAGQVLTETNPLGNTKTYAYNAAGKVTSITDPMGRTSSFEYNGSGYVTREIGPSGQVETEFTYTAGGNIASQSDANGRVTQFEYDQFGNQTAIVKPNGSRTEYDYDANGSVTAERNPDGVELRLVSDANGKPSRVTDADGNITNLTYSYSGSVLGVTDALGNVTSQTYDVAGNELTFTNPEGETVSKTYNAQGKVRSVTSPGGSTRQFEYDPLGRLIRKIAPDGGVQEEVYDASGRVLRRIDPLGNEDIFAYDAMGQNIQRTDALGNVYSFEYDGLGNLVRSTDAKGNVFRNEFNILNQLTRRIFPDLTENIYSYDAADNVTQETDALGRTTSYSYDLAGNLIGITNPAGGVTTYQYDSRGNLVSAVDARGNTTTYVYDDSGLQTSKSYPDGSSIGKTHDATGRVLTSTDGSGDVTTYSYDDVGRLLAKNFVGGASESYTYTVNGQVATASNGSTVVTYTYDANDRLSSKAKSDGSSIFYQYDLAGNRTRVGANTGSGATRNTDYSYDALNRIAVVTDPDGSSSSYTYDEIGNVASITYPNGVVSSFVYDSQSRLARISHVRGGSTIAEYVYTVNAAGERTGVDHDDGSRVQYSYDLLQRLTLESHFDAVGTKVYELQYSYDAVGNRTGTLDLNGLTVAYAYDDADKLLSAGAETFSYDSDGNLSERNSPAGLTSYDFDVENQLVGVQTPADTISYSYDAGGQRIARSANGTTTNFLVDERSSTGYAQVAAEYDGSGVAQAEYTYGHNLLGQNRAGLKHYHHGDAMRNVRVLTDGAGLATDSIEYDGYGNVLASTGATANSYQFAGERTAGAEGLVYLRARYYDPTTGRFISRDPFGGFFDDPMSLHRYLYAHANPISNLDPSGKSLLANVSVASAISGGLISFTIAAVSGKRGWALVTDTIIGAAFGAIGGPMGTAIGNAFKESKLLLSLLRNKAVGVYVARLATAIPITVLNASEDIYKAAFNGDIAKSGFWSDFAANTMLNLLFNTISGPGIEIREAKEITKAFKRGSSISLSSGGKTVHHLLSASTVFIEKAPREVVHFVQTKSDEALDLFFGFLLEFTKLMRTELPKFVYGSGNN